MELVKLRDWTTALHGLSVSIALLSIALCLGPLGRAEGSADTAAVPSVEPSERIVIGLPDAAEIEPEAAIEAAARTTSHHLPEDASGLTALMAASPKHSPTI